MDFPTAWGPEYNDDTNPVWACSDLSSGINSTYVNTSHTTFPIDEYAGEEQTYTTIDPALLTLPYMSAENFTYHTPMQLP
jgi:hypothetical protein